jgi:hypothetical protein
MRFEEPMDDLDFSQSGGGTWKKPTPAPQPHTAAGIN